jgi:hypothetical protein
LADFGLVDVQAELGVKAYTFWRTAGHRRSDLGMRLDYFLASRRLLESGLVSRLRVRGDVKGSDHCPLEIFVDKSLFHLEFPRDVAPVLDRPAVVESLAALASVEECLAPPDPGDASEYVARALEAADVGGVELDLQGLPRRTPERMGHSSPSAPHEEDCFHIASSLTPVTSERVLSALDVEGEGVVPYGHWGELLDRRRVAHVVHKIPSLSAPPLVYRSLASQAIHSINNIASDGLAEELYIHSRQPVILPSLTVRVDVAQGPLQRSWSRSPIRVRLIPFWTKAFCVRPSGMRTLNASSIGRGMFRASVQLITGSPRR